jgi:threonylcarbamoyladenosine tRNA methylthiotransferase MtaB
LTVIIKNAILARVKVYLSTLGCKLNESELEAWTRRFANDGYEIVNDPHDADLIVLNTCTVTHIAARKSRQMTRQLARANPNAQIVLTGCFVDISPDEARKLPNVSLIVPNADKDRLVERISDFRFQVSDFANSPTCDLQSAIDESKISHRPIVQSPTAALRTRAFVKVQDGCNMACTYCIIPFARGKDHSRSPQDIVAEVKSLVDSGYKEIILTGVQISAYRHSIATSREAIGDKAISPSSLKDYLAPSSHGMTYALRDLVAAILSETNVPRLRLTSIAPWDLDESLLELWNDPRLCRHLHLSLQSGSDTVLKRMRRPYTTAQFAHAVELARNKITDLGITTDVIVGFPGESDVEFEQSMEFVRAMQFSRVHVFPYSKRDGTIAANLPLQVTDAVKESRAKQMQAIADASQRQFARQFIGKSLHVLWESVERNQWSGYTDNYIRIIAESDKDLRNQFANTRLVAMAEDGLRGELL